MAAPMPLDAPVTMATLPLSLLMTFPEGGWWSEERSNSVVRNIRTMELIVKGWYDESHAALGSPIDRRHHRGGHPACPVRSCTCRDLCRAGGLVRRHHLLELPSGQRSQHPQIHAFTTLQGAQGSRVDPERTARRGKAQHQPLQGDRAALPGIDRRDFECAYRPGHRTAPCGEAEAGCPQDERCLTSSCSRQLRYF